MPEWGGELVMKPYVHSNVAFSMLFPVESGSAGPPLSESGGPASKTTHLLVPPETGIWAPIPKLVISPPPSEANTGGTRNYDWTLCLEVPSQ